MSVVSNPSISLSGLAGALSVKSERHSEFTQERWLRGSDGLHSVDYSDKISFSADQSFEAGVGFGTGTLSLPAPHFSRSGLAQPQPHREPPPARTSSSDSSSKCSKDSEDAPVASMEDLRAYLIERIFGVSMGKRLDAAELSKGSNAADEMAQALQDAYPAVSPQQRGGNNRWLDAGVRRTEKVSESIELEATLQAQVSDGKGGTITQSVNVKIQVSQEMIHTEEARIQIGKPKDPLVIDLTGSGFSLTGIENGTVFDLNGDGHAEKSATVSGGTGLLWMDRNGNGKLDNGNELFGDSNGASDGFDALALLDSDHNGSVDALDARFKDIRIQLADGRNLTLDQAKVAALSVAHLSAKAALGQNSLDALGVFTKTDGSLGALGEVQFGREEG